MPLTMTIILFTAPLAAIAMVFAFLHLLTRITGGRGHAPGWQVRCTTCHTARDAADVGVIRTAAASVGKHTFGYCSHCGGMRWIAIERKADSPAL